MLSPEQLAKIMTAGVPAADLPEAATVFIARDGVLVQGTLRAGVVASAKGLIPLADGETVLTAAWADTKPLDLLKVVATGVRHCNVHGQWRVWDDEAKRARCSGCKDVRVDARKAKRQAAQTAKMAKALDALV